MEKFRAALRAKVNAKISEMVRMEEESARKVIEEDNELDEEYLANLMQKMDEKDKAE